MSAGGVRAAADARRSVAPVRGTQSFVGVMAAVWKRPSLTGLEIAWRWIFGLIAFGCVWFFAHDALMVWALKWDNLGPILVRGHLVARGTVDVMTYLWPLLGGIVAWSVFAGLGRGAVLRRWDRSLQQRRGAAVVLAILRSFSFAALLVVWFALLLRIARSCIWTQLDLGLEPAYVPAFALAVMTTLLLFVFWAATNWVLRIAPILAMSEGLGPFASLRAALRNGPLRSKLIEINLVMGIVKVALLVLALVFSACPLPFQSVESQTFLTSWWIGVGVFYVVASDYFHAVRAAAYQTLYRMQQSSASNDMNR